jgi:hypothetical protein
LPSMATRSRATVTSIRRCTGKREPTFAATWKGAWTASSRSQASAPPATAPRGSQSRAIPSGRTTSWPLSVSVSIRVNALGHRMAVASCLQQNAPIGCDCAPEANFGSCQSPYGTRVRSSSRLRAGRAGASFHPSSC